MPRVLAIAQFIVFALGTMALHIFRKLEYVPREGETSLQALLIGDSLWVAVIPIVYLAISELFQRRQSKVLTENVMGGVGVVILLGLLGVYTWRLSQF